MTWLACTIGAVACLPFGPALVRETADARPSTIWWVVFLGAFPTALAFAGGALCLIGVAISRRGPKQPADLPPVDPGD